MRNKIWWNYCVRQQKFLLEFDFVYLDNFKQLGVTWLPPISMQCHQVRPPDSLHLLKLVCPLVKASFGQVHQAWSRFKLSQAVLGKLTIAPSNSSMCNISCDISTMQQKNVTVLLGGHVLCTNQGDFLAYIRWVSWVYVVAVSPLTLHRPG